MPGWNGSGQFVRIYSWVSDALAGIPITASRMDADTNNITANGFNNCLTRDGQGSATDDLPMNNFRHIGVGPSNENDQYATVLQIQDNNYLFAIAGGTVDAITASFNPILTTLVDGMQVCVRAIGSNTSTTPTFKPDGTTQHRITKVGNQPLIAGDIVTDLDMILRYNLINTRWELLNPRTLTGVAQTPWAVAAGTVDAITAAYVPVNASLTDGLLLGFRASGANATTAPTFAPDGLTARTITKSGGVALVAGDIPGNLAECLVRYNLANTRWELLNARNPINSPVILATGNLDTGTAIAKALDLSTYTAYSRIDIELQGMTGTATGGTDLGIRFSTDAVTYIATNTYAAQLNGTTALTAQAQINCNAGFTTNGDTWLRASFYNLNVAKPCRVYLQTIANFDPTAAPLASYVVGVNTTSAITAVQFLYYDGTTPVVTGGTYRIVGYI